MKLSKDTLTILKNFSEINSGIHFRQGNSLATWHTQKYVLAAANIQETFQKDFTVFDLNRLLSTISLFDAPDFDFSDDRVVISTANKSVNFFYCDPNLVLDPEDRPSKWRSQILSGSIATSTLSREDLKSLRQAVSILGLPDIQFVGKNNKMVITATDTANSSSDLFKIVVDAELKQDFTSVIRSDHFKVLDGDYSLVCHPDVAYLKHNAISLEYWIAFQSQD